MLDVGCGWGYVAEHLFRKGCRVTGVEPDAERLRQAVPWCERTIVGTAEELDRLGLDPGGFDVVMFVDVLEHLVDPWRILKGSLRYLRPGGRVIISIPNFANYGVRLNLLRGRFRYQESGVYDRTHLRHFTRETVEEMVHGAGLRIVEWRYAANLTETNLFKRTLGRAPFLTDSLRGVDAWLTERCNRLLAVQFVIACEPEAGV